MSDWIVWTATAVSLASGIVAALVGARSVRELRKATGDDSKITAILSGEAFSKVAPSDPTVPTQASARTSSRDRRVPAD